MEIVINNDNVKVKCGKYESKKGNSYYACKLEITAKNTTYTKFVSFDLQEIARFCGLSVVDLIDELNSN